MGSMQYIGDGTILPCRTMPYELPSHLAQRINAACGGDKINSLLMNIPEGGKGAIKAACLKIPGGLFTESGFDHAWKSASTQNKISVANKDKYLSKQ
ncbi:hypothetical protein [Methylomonas koyamae]|uniref:hypothetical protein n=1 Tax=Methylomonas koyamae TaxID=702114 RepID=UPI002872BA25|nr:hypothetical protein [Methylomonas koyamae]WNB76776.1 hypothetical protein RI210_04180 [Methylomonas koyamae]